jgi:hypothetical protein
MAVVEEVMDLIPKENVGLIVVDSLLVTLGLSTLEEKSSGQTAETK